MDEVIEAFCAAREMRNVSYKWLDECGGFCFGHLNKIMGARREKGVSPFVFQMLCSMLAVKFVMVPDPEQEARMRDRWEGRDLSNVRDSFRISARQIDRVRPHVLKEVIDLLKELSDRTSTQAANPAFIECAAPQIELQPPAPAAKAEAPRPSAPALRARMHVVQSRDKGARWGSTAM